MLFFPKFSGRLVAVIVVAVILLWSAVLGANTGKGAAQSSIVLKNAESLAKGLEYFYQDQDRYPTAAEMSAPSLMLNYFNAFPPADVLAGDCAQSYSYKRPSKNSYELSFCIPKSSGGFQSGWNTVTWKK